jgi:hypothetical protein
MLPQKKQAVETVEPEWFTLARDRTQPVAAVCDRRILDSLDGLRPVTDRRYRRPERLEVT